MLQYEVDVGLQRQNADFERDARGYFKDGERGTYRCRESKKSQGSKERSSKGVYSLQNNRAIDGKTGAR